MGVGADEGDQLALARAEHHTPFLDVVGQATRKLVHEAPDTHGVHRFLHPLAGDVGVVQRDVVLQ